jgi:hypothetical protein
MRRSFRALVLLGLMLIFVSAPAASADHRSPAILCPGAYSPPCCGPVVAQPGVIPCCMPVAASPGVIPCCVPTKFNCPLLTISSSGDPSSARQAIKITGRLTPVGSPGAAVTLWQELPGQSSFNRVAQAKTDSTGAYRFTRRAGSVRTNRSWYVTALSLRSATWAQMVKAVLSLSISAKKTAAGENVTFRGRVTPSHAGERIRLQEHAGGWKTFTSARLTAGSTFSVRESFAGSGAALVRAALSADSRNIASHSATVRTEL